MNGDELHPDTMLWRYMPLRWFESLLQNKIWFSRPFSWPDRWDSRLPSSLGHNLSPSDIETLKDSLLVTDQNNRYAHFVNCWHVSNEESLTMWQQFGDMPNGVAIQSTVGDVRFCITSHGSGNVEYYDPSQIMPPQPLFGARGVLFKRQQFSFEKEFRIWRFDDEILNKIQRKEPICENALTKGCLFHLSDTYRLIRRVVLAPGASSQVRTDIEGLCSLYKRTKMHTVIQPSALEALAQSQKCRVL